LDVTADDLTRALGGAERKERAPRWRIPVAPILSAFLAMLFAAAGAYVALVDDPLAGEPHVIVPIETLAAAVAPAGAEPSNATPARARGEPKREAAEVEQGSGVSVVRPNGTSAPGAVIIQVPEPEAVKLRPAPDRRLVERTRYGLLPKVGPDGSRPADVYARPAGALPGGATPAARIAILVTGLGISQSSTAAAIVKLPAPVTLAFAPYGTDLERHVAQARGEGHEVMLQVPMEPFDYPDNDPGPHTLTAAAKVQENLDKLQWAMGRFTGYVGLVNFMGAKLTADEAALAPMLKEIGARGLAFLDDGSSSRSLVGTLAPALRMPASRADRVIDGIPQAEAVDKELARLEELARKKGFALGTASALPLSVERIARWSRELESRNILLVPVSAAFGREGR
jgi:polysaccharide deacetylase 2 family uncharacterized protein YibQ